MMALNMKEIPNFYTANHKTSGIFNMKRRPDYADGTHRRTVPRKYTRMSLCVCSDQC